MDAAAHSISTQNPAQKTRTNIEMPGNEIPTLTGTNVWIAERRKSMSIVAGNP